MELAISQQTIARVAPLSGLDRALVYTIPEALRETIAVGTLVEIPLGRRSVLGLVVGFGAEGPMKFKLKAIEKLVYDQPVTSPDLLKLAVWMQRYYAASVESVYETLIPAKIRGGATAKEQKFLALNQDLSKEDLGILEKRAPKQFSVYVFLKESGAPVSITAIRKKFPGSEAAYRTLVKKTVLKEQFEVQEHVAYTDTLSQAEHVGTEAPILNEEQQAAATSIQGSIDSAEFKVHLLHGVTGSGKTEVYLSAIQKALSAGGSVLFLVPEVALTPQTVGRIRTRLDAQGIKTVVWHSHLSEAERLDAWFSLVKGEAQVVVGARSALFAPLKDLRLIVVDEEHEPAYKQDETPRYHGRDVAVYRGMLCKATVVLGSATPSLESLYNVKARGYILNRLTKRIDDRKLPRFHVVDMKREALKHKGSDKRVISQLLKEKLQDRLEKKEQSILFINRRGYSSSMVCSECGYVAECEHCSNTLTYHRTDQVLRCHLCGSHETAPDRCPGCESPKIRWQGFGTQRIEDVVQQVVPKANVVRIDADTLSKRNRFREILSDFRTGKIDVLVGTQMIAKGLDFPNVTLVGMVDADIGMHVPDFRASERTFQLLVQVAGRAGRGDRAGEVVVQSFAPHSPPIQFARRADFEGFLEEELEQRREFNYPPFRNLIRHLFRSRNKEKVAFYSEQWIKFLEKGLKQKIEIRGPVPAPLERVKDYYRFHAWFFVGNVSKVLPEIVALRQQFKMDKEVIDVFDVDPRDLT